MTSKVSPGQPEGAFLRLLRTVANIAVLFGSAWSVRFTLQAGHRSPSRFLMALFVIWVSCPFLALVFAIFNSQDWSILSRAMVYSVVLILSLPGLIAGIGLLKFRPWARILGIVISALDLMSVPIGTAIGIYGLWVLLSNETEALFRNASAYVTPTGPL